MKNIDTKQEDIAKENSELEKDSPIKRFNRHLFIQNTIILALAAAVGVSAGIVAKRQFGQEEIDYSGFDPESYRGDGQTLLGEYNKNPSKAFTPAELVNIGLEKYRQCENSYSIGIGKASTIVTQTIRNAQIKNGDEYFEESISKSSMVSIANRVRQTNSVDEVDLYRGNAIDAESASYTDNKEAYTLEKYKEAWGKTLNEMFIYLISNKTTLEGSKVENLSNGYKKVTLKLDPEISTYYYKIQMKTMSNLDRLPVFDYLTHTYVLDKNMMLVQATVEEKYQASMSVSVSITNNIDYYYHANEYLKIPQLDESVSYSIEGEIKL